MSRTQHARKPRTEFAVKPARGRWNLRWLMCADALGIHRKKLYAFGFMQWLRPHSAAFLQLHGLRWYDGIDLVPDGQREFDKYLRGVVEKERAAREKT